MRWPSTLPQPRTATSRWVTRSTSSPSSASRHYELVGISHVRHAPRARPARVAPSSHCPRRSAWPARHGQIKQVIAKAEEGISQQELVDRIAPVLPENTEVITGVEAGEQLSSDVQSGFQFFSIALQVFGGIALLVGVFVISNTFSILVAQRTRELALLRAVGASRGQVLGSVLLEAASSVSSRRVIGHGRRASASHRG